MGGDYIYMRVRPQDSPNQQVLVVVPAYNEQESIGDVVRQIHAQNLGDVLVVDDGSADFTYRAASQAGASVLRLPFNLGIGGAVQAGLKYAAEKGYAYVVRLDGDGQHRADEAKKLLDFVQAEQADVAIGSRFIPGHHTYKAPLARAIGIKWFGLLISLITGSRSYDTTSGMQALNRRAIRFLARSYPQDYPEVEARVLMHKASLHVEEIPASMEPRRAGISSITYPRAVYYVIKVSLATFISLLRRNATQISEEM